MPKPYSGDLRARVIEEIATGASRREAAERYGISPSVVVIWAQRFEKTGSVAAKPSGGSISPLEDHAEFLLAQISAQPDLTLDEVVVVMEKQEIPGGRSALWRFFERRNISFKKKSERCRVNRADVARARRRWMREQVMFDPARLVFVTKRGRTPAWCDFERQTQQLPARQGNKNRTADYAACRWRRISSRHPATTRSNSGSWP